jgi:signal transduction histidine kinase/DNA-binding response OmpR family regulator
VSTRILSVAIDFEQDIVSVRQRARQIAALLGFDNQDQVRIATAVSEIARNAYRYAGRGSAEFALEGATAPQLLIVRVSDRGPGIAQLDTILSGEYRSSTGMGLGIVGARRLMDNFEIRSAAGKGTEVVLKKMLPAGARYMGLVELSRIGEILAANNPETPLQEVETQNRELLRALQEVRERQDDLERLNRELEDTNRGVVALYAELDEQADHLRRADEMKSRFLSNMSHEFRTPLNSIRALARLLLDHTDGPLTAEQEKQVGFMRKAAEDLAQVVDDLLDLAKIEAGKVEVQPTDFSVSELFSALRGMLKPLLVVESVQLRFDEVDDLPLMHTDEAKVSQILRNFISNALKFTERGEVRVSATLDPAGERITFAVADTGIGIAPEDQPRVFEEFTQVQGPLQRKVKGTGLGLPLCRNLAMLLGGNIALESERGVGSTFFATVPVRFASADHRESDPAADEIDVSRVHVLVVEDDEHMQLAYEKMLRDTPYQGVTARTLRQATDALAQSRPAAILLDLVLRGEQAWQWLSEVKRNPATCDVPVIVVSTTEDQRKAFALGAEAYLVKPVARQALLARLDELTKGRVLLIDDDAAWRYTMRKMLSTSRHSVIEAADGGSGLTSAASAQPSVIVLDLGLPDISGEEVLQRLYDDPATRDIPVVIATSRDLSAGEHATLAARAKAVLNKRDWESELVPRLNAILDGATAESRA